jgi:serine/threonine protein phosphatase 1
MSSDPPPSERSRVYAVGDIHGRADLLDRMIGEIGRDLAADPAADALTVTLGDYVDRGPDSRGVIERLARNPFPTDFVALKGNHEVLLQTFLHDASIADHWRRLGGLETLHSYRVAVAPLMMGRNYEQTAKALADAIPPEHFAFLASLKSSLTVGKYFLCQRRGKRRPRRPTAKGHSSSCKFRSWPRWPRSSWRSRSA